MNICPRELNFWVYLTKGVILLGMSVQVSVGCMGVCLSKGVGVSPGDGKGYVFLVGGDSRSTVL